MKTFKQFSEQAYSSKAQIDEGLCWNHWKTIGKVAKKPLQKAAKGVMNWFNKGKGTRYFPMKHRQQQNCWNASRVFQDLNPNPKHSIW